MEAEKPHLPVIDFSSSRALIVQQVAQACRTWGGFQVLHHGVSTETVSDARAQSRALFALPTGHKLRAKRMPGGFSGYGNGAVVNKETLNEEYYSEAITLGYGSDDAVSIGRKVWPGDGNPEFR